MRGHFSGYEIFIPIHSLLSFMCVLFLAGVLSFSLSLLILFPLSFSLIALIIFPLSLVLSLSPSLY